MTDSDSRGQTAVMARSPWLMGASRAILLYISTTSAWAGRAWEHVEQKQLSLLAPLDKPFIPPPKKVFPGLAQFPLLEGFKIAGDVAFGDMG